MARKAKPPASPDIAIAIALAADALQWALATTLIKKGILTKAEVRDAVNGAARVVDDLPDHAPKVLVEKVFDEKLINLDALSLQ